jgi:hypothetical protein
MKNLKTFDSFLNENDGFGTQAFLLRKDRGVYNYLFNLEKEKGGQYGFNLIIGKYSNPEYGFNGWLDEFRISKGIARWKSNFTPLTREYTKEYYGSFLYNFI